MSISPRTSQLAVWGGGALHVGVGACGVSVAGLLARRGDSPQTLPTESAPWVTRTPDHRIRSPMLYPAELRGLA